ncbi:MAG: hypothetical protein JOZ54_12465, partial [Acidobacteria bacterium]|nr:hypothetical protein [Acidobacteriota bacterium]
PAVTEWTLFDKNGNLKVAGSIAEPTISTKIPIAPRNRFHAENCSLHVGGQPSVGELDVVFGSEPADLTAPTITSLRVENGSALHLAIADFNLPQVAVRNLPAEGVRVAWRPHGTESWHDLQAVVLDEEDGSLLTLGHIPAGTILRVDLAAATAAEGYIDLRIEARDDAGNSISWKQSPSILASGSAPPRRRRPATP